MGMELKQRQQVRQIQTVAMTPAMQQAVKILNQTQQELEMEVRQALADNPFLEELTAEQEEEQAREREDREALARGELPLQTESDRLNATEGGGDQLLSRQREEGEERLAEKSFVELNGVGSGPSSQSEPGGDPGEAGEWERSLEEPVTSSVTATDKRPDIDWVKFAENSHLMEHSTASTRDPTGEEEELDPLERVVRDESMEEDLMNQIHLLQLDEDELEAAEFIVSNLDEDGYLTFGEPLVGDSSAFDAASLPEGDAGEFPEDFDASSDGDDGGDFDGLTPPDADEDSSGREGARKRRRKAIPDAPKPAFHRRRGDWISPPPLRSGKGTKDLGGLDAEGVRHSWEYLRFCEAPAISDDSERKATLPPPDRLVFGDPVIRVAGATGLRLSKAEALLKKLQRDLDPVGLASRDLQECLQVQLEALLAEERQSIAIGEITPAQATSRETGDLAKDLLSQPLMDDVLNRRVMLLAKALRRPPGKVEKALDLIGRLDPRPGRKFFVQVTQNVRPDLYVRQMGLEDDGTPRLVVEMNDDLRPRLRVKRDEELILKSKENREGKKFVQEKLQGAQQMVTAIEERRKTIRLVMDSIIRHQREFFLKGITALKPLTLRDVAEDIGRNESTVCRATNGKYVETPQGLFSLKDFFNASLASDNGAGETANEAVKVMIRKLVDEEDKKHPRSDEKLAGLLKLEGVIVARRTVAKYREQMGIEPTSKRRRH